jgi:hypothetical protein
VTEEKPPENEGNAHSPLRACRHDPTTKLLNKALDRRHRLAIHQFAKAGEEADVRLLWREAAGRGDIPGAYWAVLTHPATTPRWPEYWRTKWPTSLILTYLF